MNRKQEGAAPMSNSNGICHFETNIWWVKKFENNVIQFFSPFD